MQLGFRDHFLVSYQASLMSICNAQFTSKALQDGIEVRSADALRIAAYGLNEVPSRPCRFCIFAP